MKRNNLEMIYEKYSRLVLKIAKEIVNDYVLAQDICQDVFVKFCEKGSKVDDEFLRAWFIVNTKRKAIDYVRRSYQKHETVDWIDGDKVENGMGTGVNDLIDNLILKDITCRFLRDLEKHNRDWYIIVVGVMIENREEKEIARELNITVANLRVKLHRAKAWIRENYKDEYDEL